MVLCLSVRLSVCLSVTSRSSPKTDKDIIAQTTLYVRQDSSYITSKILTKFQGVSFQSFRRYDWDVEI